MNYRTKTYIAADWSNDKNAVDQIYKWLESEHWGLHFPDAHDITQARDSSLNCSIKKSLKERMDVSKTFVLIVGEKTNTLTAGSCQHCSYYSGVSHSCLKKYSSDYRSFIKYECDKAVEAGIKIIVLYKSTSVNKSKCPEVLQNIGIHVPMIFKKDNTFYWDYQAVKKAFDT